MFRQSNRIPLLFLSSLLALLLVVLIVRGTSQDSNPQSVEVSSQVAEAAVELSQHSPRSHTRSHYPQRSDSKSSDYSYSEYPSSNTDQKKYTESQRSSLTFDINTADSTDLQQLRGIGPVYARRIVRYRELLGGFHSLNQLTEVYGITAELAQQIAKSLYVGNAPLRTLNPNTASLEELKRHPYLDYYQAKAIVTYRNSGGSYHNTDDLLKVTLLDEATIRRLQPYLSFS